MATINVEVGTPITDPKAAHNFIMAGNAYVTFVSKKTGERRTYRVSKAKDYVDRDQQSFWSKKNKAEVKVWFVSLLMGTDNTSDYVYLGIIQDGAFRLTRKSKMTSESIPVKAFSWAFTQLSKGVMPEMLEVWHHGRCGRCGRMLTVPEYKVNGVLVAGIALGIGPECAGKF